MFVIIQDITERKTIELKLKNSEAKFRKILNNFTDGIYICSPDYKIEYMNTPMAKLIGMEKIGTSCYKSIYNFDEKCDWCVSEKLKHGQSADYEISAPSINGDFFVKSIFLENGSVLYVFYDMTKIKEAEKEIRKLSTAVEQSANTIIITDLKGNIEYVNPKFTELTGYTTQEAIGQNPKILQAGTQSKEFYDELWQTIKSGKPWHGEFHNKTKDNKLFWEQSTITPIKDKAGNIINYLAVKEDITARKIAEYELIKKNKELIIEKNTTKENEKKLSRLLQKLDLHIKQTPLAVIDWDLSFKVNSWNKSAEKIFGFTKNEAIGRHASELIIPSNSKEQINDIWLDIIKNKGGNRSINENITKDGNIITCVWYNTPLVNEQGKVISVTSLVLDITEQQIAEQSLKESESRYRTIIENISDGLLIVNNNSEFLSVNSAYCKMHGYTMEEMLKIKSKDIVHPNYSDVFGKFKESLQETGFFEGEVIDIHKNGSLVYVYIKGKSFNYANEKAVLVIVSDITKQKDMDKAMLNAVIKTEEKERSRIAKDLHDGLGPILSTIKLYNQWIQNPDKKTSHEYIFDKSTDAIEEAIKSVKEISNNLSPHVLTNYGIATAIKSFIDKLNILNEIEIVFETNLSERLKDPIIETTLYRIFTECVNNTLKYAKADEVHIRLIKDDDKIEMVYSDNGIGFDVDKQLRKSKGLGLNNIINRVKTINGQCNITSYKKSGTKIDIKLILNN